MARWGGRESSRRAPTGGLVPCAVFRNGRANLTKRTPPPPLTKGGEDVRDDVTDSNPGCGRSPDRATIFFAGLVNEYMKGFHVLHAACAKLWEKRQDFELVATADPAGQFDSMTRFVGWLSQEELPNHIRQAGFLVFPTIAEEGAGPERRGSDGSRPAGDRQPDRRPALHRG